MLGMNFISRDLPGTFKEAVFDNLKYVKKHILSRVLGGKTDDYKFSWTTSALYH